MVSAVFFCHVIMSLHGLQPTVPYFDISCWTRSANYTIFHLKILMRVDIKDENFLSFVSVLLDNKYKLHYALH